MREGKKERVKGEGTGGREEANGQHAQDARATAYSTPQKNSFYTKTPAHVQKLDAHSPSFQAEVQSNRPSVTSVIRSAEIFHFCGIYHHGPLLDYHINSMPKVHVKRSYIF